MKAKSVTKKRLFVLYSLGTLLVVVSLSALEVNLVAASAGAGTHHVCPMGPPTCDYDSIQDAVDVAATGDTIKVAEGTYTGVEERPAPAGYEGPDSVRQMIYLTKTVTIQGGYATGDWTTSDPAAHPTTLDAGGQGRVLFVAGEIAPVLEGLRLTGGDASDLGGTWWTDAGGGAYVLTAAVTLKQSLIYENVAGSYEWGGAGGGLFLASSPSTVRNCTIRDNVAGAVAEGYGGGLALYMSDAAIRDSRIHGNLASTGDWGFGGGADLYASEVLLSGNEIYGNTASSADEGYGGGLHIDGAMVSVTNNTIRDNTASTEYDGYGGGMYLSEADATVVGNMIKGNVASDSNSSYGYGGGLDLWQSDATLSRNIIRENVASAGAFGLGGGLVLSDSSAGLVNNAVIDNRAGGHGSGFYIGGGAPTLTHTTIARNHEGDGTGLYVSSGGTPVLRNAILVNQTTGIMVESASTAQVEGVLWFGNGSNSGGDGSINVSQASTGNPAFAADGYHLLAESAAIDAGLDAGTTDDIDGQVRPIQSPDLGADEYWPSGELSSIYLPLVRAR
jgi:hypothetical protein